MILRERLGPHWGGCAHIGGEFLKEWCPLCARAADDLVVGALASDVLVGWNGRENGDAGRRGKCCGLAGAIVFIDDHARHTHIATELAEILHRGADIVGHIEGLKVIASHHDDLLTHVSCDGQSKATADDIAQEVQQNEVESPVMKAQFLKGLKAVDDAATAAAAANLGASKFHRKDAIALKADVANRDGLAGELLAGGRLDDGRAGLSTKEQ